METKFTQVSISDEQAKTVLDLYLCAKANDSRDLVEIYGSEILHDLAEMGLITSEQQGGTTNFYLSGKGYELAKILDHEKNGTPYNESYLRVPISGSGSN